MDLQNALFNWLQISLVANARKDDTAAVSTVQFFEEILHEDHHVTNITITQEENVYRLHFEKDGEKKTHSFDADSAEKLREDIKAEPRYNQ